MPLKRRRQTKKEITKSESKRTETRKQKTSKFFSQPRLGDCESPAKKLRTRPPLPVRPRGGGSRGGWPCAAAVKGAACCWCPSALATAETWMELGGSSSRRGQRLATGLWAPRSTAAVEDHQQQQLRRSWAAALPLRRRSPRRPPPRLPLLQRAPRRLQHARLQGQSPVIVFYFFCKERKVSFLKPFPFVPTIRKKSNGNKNTLLSPRASSRPLAERPEPPAIIRAPASASSIAARPTLAAAAAGARYEKCRCRAPPLPRTWAGEPGRCSLVRAGGRARRRRRPGGGLGAGTAAVAVSLASLTACFTTVSRKAPIGVFTAGCFC